MKLSEVNLQKYIYVCIYICVCMCVCVHIYIYILERMTKIERKSTY